VIISAVFLVLAACGGEGESGGEAAAWPVASEPEVRIGELEGDPWSFQNGSSSPEPRPLEPEVSQVTIHPLQRGLKIVLAVAGAR